MESNRIDREGLQEMDLQSPRVHARSGIRDRDAERSARDIRQVPSADLDAYPTLTIETRGRSVLSAPGNLELTSTSLLGTPDRRGSPDQDRSGFRGGGSKPRIKRPDPATNLQSIMSFREDDSSQLMPELSLIKPSVGRGSRGVTLFGRRKRERRRARR